MSDHLHNRAVDKIHEAVEAAIDADMTVQRFVSEARESWKMVYEEKARLSSIAFDELVKKSL